MRASGQTVKLFDGWTDAQKREWVERMGELGDPEGCTGCGAIAGCCDRYPNCPGNPDWKPPEARGMSGDELRTSANTISKLRSIEELQRAHDLLVGIIMRHAPFPDVGFTMRDINLMASVLCWCMQHEYNDQFPRVLEKITADMAAHGYVLEDTRAPAATSAGSGGCQ
jgi:hypothetical protein